MSSPTLDLSRCDREPIHIPGAVQPHGVLLVVREPSFEVIQASSNAADVLGTPSTHLVGQPLDAVLSESAAEQLRTYLAREQTARPVVLPEPVVAGREGKRFDLIFHRAMGGLIVEMEPHAGKKTSTLPPLQESLERLQEAEGVQALCKVATAEVRRLTGFDRVKVYRFDPDWNGEVLAESRAEHIDSYLGLHFPSTDIPQQARHLYTLNRLRLIPNVAYTPAPLEPADNPDTGAPLDLSFSVLRSVSPVHMEYLRNMGVGASMSISVVHEGRLWGLIACHHAAPLYVPYRVRTACELFGQIFALMLTSTQEVEDRQQEVQRSARQARLLEAMVRVDDFVDGLATRADDLLALVKAQGAAVVGEEECITWGTTPDEAAIRALAAWLEEQGGPEVFDTDRLARVYGDGEALTASASGLLAISLSRLQRYYVMWFRPERPQTVYWAGDPRKAVQEGTEDTAQLHPRHSFAAWKDILRGRSPAWTVAERDAARELRRAISDVVFFKMEELARLNASLAQSNRWLRHRNRELRDFAYIASHDLQEPLRKIRAFGSLLQAEHAAQLDADGLRFLDRMAKAAEHMSALIADLLSFSVVVTHGAPFSQVDLRQVVEAVLQELGPGLTEANAHTEVGPLPLLEADAEQIRRLVRHLLDNAVKFRRPDVPLRVQVASEVIEGVDLPDMSGPVYRFTIKDNGQGFDIKYLDRLFLPFQRLHVRGTYSGTGIGLAIAKRIVERHGGTITAESTPGEGSTFIVLLPVTPPAVSLEEA